MTDLLVVLVTLALFALCTGYVHLCDRVIGPDDIAAAPVRQRRRATRAGEGRLMDNVIGLMLAVALAAYFVYVLIFPERF